MTPKQAVKLGFLLACARDGLNAKEMHAMVKLAAVSVFDILGGLGSTGLLLGVGLPIGIGAGTGYLLAKRQDDPTWDIEKAKMEELEEEYRRLAAESRVRARRMRAAAMADKRISRLGGPRLK